MENEFIKNKANWENLGSNEPYWSVLTNNRFLLNELTNENKNKFFESGAGVVKLIHEVCKKADISYKKGSCLEFGCGLGRVTFHLAKEFSYVLGVDISKNHIELANKRKYELKNNNVDFLVLKNGLEDIDRKNFDLIFSLIVLQHIKKNEVFKIFSKFMELINNDGIIIFQIPTFHPNYDFNIEKVINDNNTKVNNETRGNKEIKVNSETGVIEMHAIHQKDVISYFYHGGFSLQGCFEVKNCGQDWLSNWFVFKK